MKLKLEQWYLNVLVVVIAVAVVLGFVSAAFGMPTGMILSIVGNLAVYLFFMIVFQAAFPFVLGFLARLYPIEWVDGLFGRRKSERISGIMNWVIGIIVALLIAWVMVAATPYVAYIPSLSVWPWEMLRWTAGYEGFNWLVALVSAFLGGIGYFVGIGEADKLHEND